MNTALSYGRQNAQQRGVLTYQQNQILNLSPTELILKLYDLGIVCIKKGDKEKAQKVITELISALNFDYQEVAMGFFKLYRYAQENLYKGNDSEALKIFLELRETWAKAYNLT